MRMITCFCHLENDKCNGHMKQCKCLIFIAFDCHCNHFYPINRKIYEKSFEKLKKNWNQPQNLSKFWDFTSNCQKHPVFFNISEKNSFLNRTIGLKKSFLNQTTYVLKKSVVPTIFLKSRFFLKSGFLKSRFHCIHQMAGKSVY